MNGNINLEVTKVLKEKHNAICDSTCNYTYEGSNARDHFHNYCLTDVGEFTVQLIPFLSYVILLQSSSKHYK